VYRTALIADRQKYGVNLYIVLEGRDITKFGKLSTRTSIKFLPYFCLHSEPQFISILEIRPFTGPVFFYILSLLLFVLLGP
jgi:hypothetical protein